MADDIYVNPDEGVITDTFQRENTWMDFQIKVQQQIEAENANPPVT